MHVYLARIPSIWHNYLHTMLATPLDPGTCLVAIDFQKGLFSFPSVHPFRDIVTNSARHTRIIKRQPKSLQGTAAPFARLGKGCRR